MRRFTIHFIWKNETLSLFIFDILFSSFEVIFFCLFVVVKIDFDGNVFTFSYLYVHIIYLINI